MRIGTSTATGLAMTALAIHAQKPSSETVWFMPKGTRNRSMLSPSTARKAGSMMTEVSMAKVTASVPPMPSEGAPVFSKNSKPVRPMATVIPE